MSTEQKIAGQKQFMWSVRICFVFQWHRSWQSRKKYSGGLDMKRKPHAGSVANRSGDRRNISASLTEENCPRLRRFQGAPLPALAFPENPRISRVVPVFSTAIPGRSPGIPAFSPVVPRVPPESQPIPPSCRLFHGNPSHFPSRATHSAGIPAFSPGLPPAPANSQVALLQQVINQKAELRQCPCLGVGHDVRSAGPNDSSPRRLQLQFPPLATS